MSLSSLFSDLAAHLQSPEFLSAARHADHPLAFIRNRKLPLHHLVATAKHRTPTLNQAPNQAPATA